MSEDMNYPNNSHKARAAQNERTTEERKVEPVVSGKATTKKKNGLTKFTDVFISSDVENVKSYIVSDLLIPAAKKIISETVSTSVDMLLYGEAKHSKKSSSSSRTSYGRYYERDRDEREYGRRAASVGYEYDEVVLDNRGDAEEILMRLQEDYIDEYGMASVLDLYDLAGITSTRYTDKNYGWTNIATAKVVPIRDGYLLRMPHVKLLK